MSNNNESLLTVPPALLVAFDAADTEFDLVALGIYDASQTYDEGKIIVEVVDANGDPIVPAAGSLSFFVNYIQDGIYSSLNSPMDLTTGPYSKSLP